jgi:cbb3-type cytochrome oxidase subunit 1
MFFAGAVMMIYNLWRTMRGDVPAERPLLAPAPAE